MQATRRKKRAAPVPPQDDSVQVRVSARAPRANSATPPVTRAHNLATALLEGVIGQLANYIENSHAVEKLIRAQTAQVLRELAHDPHLSELIRGQAEQQLAELVRRPEILEPLARVQLDRYLDHLLEDSSRMRQIAESIRKAEAETPPKLQKRKVKARANT